METAEGLENLFLLEILVDKVELDWNKIDLDKEELKSLKQICIRFQYRNYPVVEVCEDDFCKYEENDKERSEVTFKNGKSCLFSLRSKTPELRSMLIQAAVLRKREEPPHQMLGYASIELGENFINVINNVRAEYDVSPITETVKDRYTIKNSSGSEIGKITLFIRLSSFGKMIITQFQITDQENKTFFFNNEDTKIPKIYTEDEAERRVSTSLKSASCMGASQVPEVAKRVARFPFETSTIDSHESYFYWDKAKGFLHIENPTRPTAPFNLKDIQQPFAFTQSIGLRMETSQNVGPPIDILGNYFPGYYGQPSMGLLGGNPFYNDPTSTTDFDPKNFKDIGLIVNGQPIDVRVAKRERQQDFRNIPYCGQIPVPVDPSTRNEVNETFTPQTQTPLGFGTQSPSMLRPKKGKNDSSLPVRENHCTNPYCPMGYPLLGGVPQRQCSLMPMAPGTILLGEAQAVFRVSSHG